MYDTLCRRHKTKFLLAIVFSKQLDEDARILERCGMLSNKWGPTFRHSLVPTDSITKSGNPVTYITLFVKLSVCFTAQLHVSTDHGPLL